MDLFAPANLPWTLHTSAWTEAVSRLRSGLAQGTLEAAALSPLVDHFELAWLELGALARLATRFAPPHGVRPLPVQHLADFILDDLLDVFRGASAEVALLVPEGRRWTGDPSPEDVLEEASRFDRYLALAGMAAAAAGETDTLSAATVRVTEALADWSTELAPLIAAVRAILEAVNYGAADGFSTTRRRQLPC